MRLIILIPFVFWATLASAADLSVEQRALADKLSIEITENLNLRAALLAANTQIEALKRQLDEAKKAISEETNSQK